MKVLISRVTLCVVIAGLCFGEEPAADSALTPRQLFYSPRTPPKNAATSKPRAPKPKPSEQTAQSPKTPPPAETPRPQQEQAKAAPEPPAYLGLRYVLRQVTENGLRDVDPDKTFFSGDRIKIAVESNDAAYLYVVQQGSDGTWEPLYPNTASQHRIRALSTVDIPPGAEDFKFDSTPGVERLLVVLSRMPETDLDKLVDSLRGGTRPAREVGGGQLMAASATPDTINRLRATLQSRNLQIEKRPEVAAGRREEAVYVVNAGMGDGSQRVVAEILLKHR